MLTSVALCIAHHYTQLREGSSNRLVVTFVKREMFPHGHHAPSFTYFFRDLVFNRGKMQIKHFLFATDYFSMLFQMLQLQIYDIDLAYKNLV